MRITGDNPEGMAELDNFILPDSRYPVIATTSKLMTTGVDAQTCKLIVLDQRIESMNEFKQIIGRGTRINEAYGKLYFTIIDFKNATQLFADPDFDGEPVQIYEPRPDEDPVPPDETDEDETNEKGDDEEGPVIIGDPPGGGGKRRKFYVDNVSVQLVGERILYYSADGTLITESLKDYTRKRVHTQYQSLDAFLSHWSTAAKKQALLDELEERGVLLQALADEVGRDYDPFDLVCHIAFDQPPLTRRERAERVRKRNYFTKYGEKARAVLEALLDKYATDGIKRIEDRSELRSDPINRIGTVLEIVNDLFGGDASYTKAVIELEEELYRAA
jgi:type I restriction enzyme R subunit